jgi:phosphoadenosine phosphosulfate reductase
MDTSFFDRHQKIAFEFSGGKDSLAALHLLHRHWDRFYVYWLNAGDVFPETLEIVNHVRNGVPNFIEVRSDVHKVIEQFGLPSDIVPCSNTALGRIIDGEQHTLIQQRYDCCARTVMMPLHDKVIADGNTGIIRGQKACDNGVPVKGGTVDGVEIFNPIINWSAEQVFEYLRANDLPVSRVYESMKTTPECMTCSAWWDDGRAAYMKNYHPEAYAKYQSRLEQIRIAVMPMIADFNKEVA